MAFGFLLGELKGLHSQFLETMWSVYCLQTIDRPHKTYIGATLDVNRRLRQHNGEIQGGASATRGRTWERIFHVQGFQSEKQALQFEWALKFYSRKLKGAPLQKRIWSLLALLDSEKVTTKAEPMVGLEVIWESEMDVFEVLL